MVYVKLEEREGRLHCATHAPSAIFAGLVGACRSREVRPHRRSRTMSGKVFAGQRVVFWRNDIWLRLTSEADVNEDVLKFAIAGDGVGAK